MPPVTARPGRPRSRCVLRRRGRSATATPWPSTDSPSGPSRPGPGPARAQRRRQDQHGRGPRGLPPPRRRGGAGPRPRPRRDHARPGGPHRGHAAAGRRVPLAQPGPGRSGSSPLLRRPRGPRRADRAVGLVRRPAHPVAAAVRRRAAAPVAGPRPGGPARGAVPRRAHRRGRPRGPPGRARHHRRPARAGASAWSSPPTSWPRPSGWPTTWSSSTAAGPWPRAPRPRWPRAPPTARSASRPGRPSTPAALASAIGAGTARGGGAPRRLPVQPPAGAATPAVIATLAAWLAERDLALGDLRTGQSLEEAYLAITGSGRDAGAARDRDHGRRTARQSRRRHGATGRDTDEAARRPAAGRADHDGDQRRDPAAHPRHPRRLPALLLGRARAAHRHRPIRSTSWCRASWPWRSCRRP